MPFFINALNVFGHSIAITFSHVTSSYNSYIKLFPVQGLRDSVPQVELHLPRINVFSFIKHGIFV